MTNGVWVFKMNGDTRISDKMKVNESVNLLKEYMTSIRGV